MLYWSVYNMPCFYNILVNRIQIKSFNPINRLTDTTQRPKTRGMHIGVLSLPVAREEIKQSEIALPNKDALVTPQKVVHYSKDIEKMALELCEEDKPFEVKRTIAAGYHELLANKKNL